MKTGFIIVTCETQLDSVISHEELKSIAKLIPSKNRLLVVYQVPEEKHITLQRIARDLGATTEESDKYSSSIKSYINQLVKSC